MRGSDVRERRLNGPLRQRPSASLAIAAGASSGIAKQELTLISQRT
jgi:hypothetical protein